MEVGNSYGSQSATVDLRTEKVESSRRSRARTAERGLGRLRGARRSPGRETRKSEAAKKACRGGPV